MNYPYLADRSLLISSVFRAFHDSKRLSVEQNQFPFMTQVNLVRFEVKHGQIEMWLNWCEELKRREKEALESMSNEGVVSEACFLSNDGKSVYYFMEAENLETAKAIGQRSVLPIDTKHRVIRESTLHGVERMKTLFNFHMAKD